MANDSITVVRMSRPVETRVLRATRDERTPLGVVDITGWSIKLVVKNISIDQDAQKIFELAASIVDATNGVYRFSFTTVHTCLIPGTYPAEILWFSNPSSGVPDDASAVDFIVLRGAKEYP